MADARSRPIVEMLREFRLELLILAIGASLMHLVFYFSDAFSGVAVVNPENAAQFGDFIGGYIGTAFALVSVVLLFATLRRQQRQTRRESFATKYFQLLSLHRANVAEMELEEETGRKVFVALIKELRAILGEVDSVGAKLKPPLNPRQRLFVAYFCLYFGVGPNSSRMLTRRLAGFDPEFLRRLQEVLANDGTRKAAQQKHRIKHLPFEGHQWRLGHYYRHLFQLVTFVHRQPESTLSDDDKYDYVKSVRAQLSTHEQALLLVNSLTPFGEIWWRDGLMTRYKMVTNIPDDFFEKSEIDIEALCLANGYFEWEDTKEFEYLPVDCRKKTGLEHPVPTGGNTEPQGN